MNKINAKILERVIFITIAFLPAAANASTFTGKIQAVRMANIGTGFVQVIVSPHGSPCTVSTMFSYAAASGGLGLVWTNALLGASMGAQTVSIRGNGICDSSGTEGIEYVEVR